VKRERAVTTREDRNGVWELVSQRLRELFTGMRYAEKVVCHRSTRTEDEKENKKE
jgi:hypothetical protein